MEAYVKMWFFVYSLMIDGELIQWTYTVVLQEQGETIIRIKKEEKIQRFKYLITIKEKRKMMDKFKRCWM